MQSETHRRIRLILQARQNNTKIAEVTNCSRATVPKWREMITIHKLSIDDLNSMTESELRKIVAPGAFNRNHNFAEPNFNELSYEVNERQVQRKTLYAEYRESLKEGEKPMSESTFYRRYAESELKRDVIISFNYEPGEMIQMDFIWRKKLKQPLLLDANGNERNYTLFCAASAMSRKTFVQAIENESKLPVLNAIVDMISFYGGVPIIVTLDNFAAAVHTPRRENDEAVITPEFLACTDHYGFSFVAARVRKPRDKAIVENSVGNAQNLILAPLRHQRFYSLRDLNDALITKVAEFNDRPMDTHGGTSRNELFAEDFKGYQTAPEENYEPGL